MPHTAAMSFSVRPIARSADGRVCPAEFSRFSQWVQARGGESPSREMLPGCGAVVEHHGQPLACAFLYLDATGSGVAWLAWLATCPATSPHRNGRALRHLIAYLTGLAKSLDYWLVCATYHHPGLLKLLKRQDFSVGDTGMTQLFKTI